MITTGWVHAEGCSCCQRPVPLAQSLDEIAFERSIQKAAAMGNRQRVKEIIQRSPQQAYSQDSSGYTALHYAAKSGDIEMCSWLLALQAFPVNATTKGGVSTALHRAAAAGHMEIVRLLLSYGADATKEDAEGNTAAVKASNAGYHEIEELLSQGK